MKKSKRLISAFLAAVLVCGTAFSAKAEAGAPVCDETLYITMDPYGEILESSVVKSYTTNGSSRIVDYGTYQTVKNMTDLSQPQQDESGKLVFQLEQPADRFYFEGSMDVAKEELPWTIKMWYRLNGQEKTAEELRGASGLIEINVDLTPNQGVLEYYRSNMALMAGTVVDMDKNLSLEAEGAQIQAMGNLNAVVFFALPGEEQHYCIRIGSDDFTFTGLVFTMVPLTVAQLDKVDDIKEAKETLEDSADAISDSLDTVFHTLGGMKQSVDDTADGLRGLDHSRQMFSDSKGKVYEDADAALADLNNLSQQFAPFSGHVKEMRHFLDTMNTHLNELNGCVEDLTPKLEDMRSTMRDLSGDLDNMSKFLNSPKVDLDAQAFVQLMEKTKADLEVFKQSQTALDTGVSALAPALAGLIGSAGSLGSGLEGMFDKDEIQSLAELMVSSGVDMGDEDEVASFLFNTTDMSTTEIEALLSYMKSATGSKATPSQADTGNLGQAVGAIVSGFHGTAGNTGLSSDLQNIITMTEGMLQSIAALKEPAVVTLGDLSDVMHLVGNLCNTLDDAAVPLENMVGTVNHYHEEISGSLNDIGKLTDSAKTSLDSLAAFSTSFENQLKAVGESLDSGTKKTLNGLAGTLDEMGDGLDQTEVLQNAKDTIKSLIDDKWEEYTTEDTTILNIDTEASPVSFTSAKNPAPRSIQIVLRTGEIKEKEEAVTVSVDESFHAEGNVFHRIASIFKRIWSMITSLFKKS